jgi:putative hydrolase of the HAD superfamily
MARPNADVKAVIFDLDNTLMDFMKMKREAVEAAAEAMVDAGLPLTEKKTISEVDRLYDKFGIEYQNIFDELLMAVMGKVDPKILAAGVVAYRQIKEGYVKPYPHVATTLSELVRRGYKVGMISDAPAFQAWTRLAGLGLHKIFDFVISFDDSGEKKPSRLPFEAGMRRLDLPASKIMMVGDNPKRDIAGAKRLGMVTVLAKYGSLMLPDPKDEMQKADYVIGGIRELLKILP